MREGGASNAAGQVAAVNHGELADHPAVRHSVYLAAFSPERGQSVADLAGGTDELPTYLVVHEDGTWAFSDDLNLVRPILFGDVDEERAAEIHRRLQPQTLTALGTPSTAPERTHPTTFIITEHDMMIPTSAQELMAQRPDHVARLATAHTPMFSAPDELASILIDTLDGD